MLFRSDSPKRTTYSMTSSAASSICHALSRDALEEQAKIDDVVRVARAHNIIMKPDCIMPRVRASSARHGLTAPRRHRTGRFQYPLRPPRLELAGRATLSTLCLRVRVSASPWLRCSLSVVSVSISPRALQGWSSWAPSGLEYGSWICGSHCHLIVPGRLALMLGPRSSICRICYYPRGGGTYVEMRMAMRVPFRPLQKHGGQCLSSGIVISRCRSAVPHIHTGHRTRNARARTPH